MFQAQQTLSDGKINWQSTKRSDIEPNRCTMTQRIASIRKSMEKFMQIYKAPIADMRFIYETFGYDKVQAMKAFEDFDLETAIAILEETGKFCTNEMLPINQSADQEGVSYDPKRTT